MPQSPLPPVPPSLRQLYSVEAWKAQGLATLDRLAAHLESAQTRAASTSFPAASPEDERQFWETKGAVINDLDRFHHETLVRSNQLHDPRYMGHQVATVLPETALTGMVTDVLNNGQAIYEMGPSNAALEDLLMNEIGQIMGLPATCGGILCHGGTLGNLVALMAAQRRLALALGIDSWQDGIGAFPKPLVVLVSKRAHYCIDRAMRTLGWGAASTLLVETDDQHRMDVRDLHNKLEACHDQGQQVLAIVGTAGTTSVGSFDPLEDIGKVCASQGIWFHVDGAHGAAAAFSDKHQALLHGLNRADSVVMDFHKVCGLPALCTGLFYRKHSDSFLPFSQEAEYLWEHANDQDWWDTGKRTFECTKRMLSTRLAAVKAAHGWGIWGELVDRLWDLGSALAHLVAGRDGWELASRPQANIVCFRPAPHGDMDTNSWNDVVRSLRKRHLAEGSGYVVQTEIDGVVWLRCTLMNPLTEEKDLVQMLDEFEALLPSVMKNMAGL